VNYWHWLFERVKRQLWWRVVAYGVAGILAAVLGLVMEEVFLWDIPFDLSADAVESLLNIIASSMLAVTTFSLGVMTAAFGAATTNVTPRATKLLMEDELTNSVLSTFIGAFLFSIVGIIVLKTGSYGERGRVVLFLITIVVIGLVVIQLLRWINHLISLGRVGATIDRVEAATSAAIDERLAVPYLGARPWFDVSMVPPGALPVYARAIGYIQFIDLRAISHLCDEAGCEAYLPSNPGTFVFEDTVVAWLHAPEGLPDHVAGKIKDHFIIEATRSFDQDPRFGLAVMAEIGSRALSPATNDPGTAIDVIGRLTRLLARWATGRSEVPVDFPRLHLHPLSDDDLFEDAFMLMARDGAGLIEVQLRLQKSLAALQRQGSESFRQAAQKQAAIALQRSDKALVCAADQQRLATFRSESAASSVS